MCTYYCGREAHITPFYYGLTFIWMGNRVVHVSFLPSRERFFSLFVSEFLSFARLIRSLRMYSIRRRFDAPWNLKLAKKRLMRWNFLDFSSKTEGNSNVAGIIVGIFMDGWNATANVLRRRIAQPPCKLINIRKFCKRLTSSMCSKDEKLLAELRNRSFNSNSLHKLSGA